MRVLVATDAWHPQVNGVVRTLTSLSQSTQRLGVSIEFLTPEGFPSIPLPTYPGLRLALPRRREVAQRIEADPIANARVAPRRRAVDDRRVRSRRLERLGPGARSGRSRSSRASFC